MKVFVCKSENVDNSNDVYINMNMNEILRAQPKFHIISTKKQQQQQNSEKSNTLLFTMQTLSPNDDQITEIVAMIT